MTFELQSKGLSKRQYCPQLSQAEGHLGAKGNIKVFKFFLGEGYFCANTLGNVLIIINIIAEMDSVSI